LQIQNFDDDVRQGVTEEGYIIIGTLGCFVKIDDESTGFLSNNHVIAGENRGDRKKDRILQPGSSVFDPVEHVGVLEDYVDLVVSPPGAKPHSGSVNYNLVDAGVARLVDGIPFSSGYLPFRSLAAPAGVAPAMYGDAVFKVGRTTGLTYGRVVDVATVVGPVPYGPGDCWFRRSIVVEGLDGTMFSDRGDSGSAVVKTSGEVIGLVYAGNGFQTYVCPIDEVLRSLECSLV
jgi:S1-C subfamily serine protease